jgi:hypothetical protein
MPSTTTNIARNNARSVFVVAHRAPHEMSKLTKVRDGGTRKKLG